MKSHPWKGTTRVVLACSISLGIGVHAAWAQHPGETAYGKVCITCHGPEGRGGLAPALAPMSLRGRLRARDRPGGVWTDAPDLGT